MGHRDPMVKRSPPLSGSSVHQAIRGVGDFFDSQDLIFADFNLQARLDAQAHFAGSFADDFARHWDLALTDDHKQNHMFANPGRIRRRKIVCSLGDHNIRPFRPSVRELARSGITHILYRGRNGESVQIWTPSVGKSRRLAQVDSFSRWSALQAKLSLSGPPPSCDVALQASRDVKTRHWGAMRVGQGQQRPGPIRLSCAGLSSCKAHDPPPGTELRSLSHLLDK
jgi:hypothetical protein